MKTHTSSDEKLLREIQIYLFKRHNYGKGQRAKQRLAILEKLYDRLGEIE
jgi:hypothetical protein